MRSHRILKWPIGFENLVRGQKKRSQRNMGMLRFSFVNVRPGESRKSYAFGDLWNKKYVTDFQN